MKTVTAYQAEDGTLFMSPIETKQYEAIDNFYHWYNKTERLYGVDGYELFEFIKKHKHTLKEYINLFCE